MRERNFPKPLQLVEVASWKRFSQVSQVRSAVAGYIEGLRDFSQDRAARGICPEDEDHAIEVFSFLPPSPSGSGILLIGGMGPLAGAIGFDLACQYFGDSREIVLYQACGIPNRVTVMQEPDRIIHGLPIAQYLVEGVSGAIAKATQYLQVNSGVPIVILLCNAVHYYLPQIKTDLQKRYPKVAASIEYVSLVEAVMAQMERRKLHRPLLLGTTATRMGRVYSEPLERRGIEYRQLSAVAQEILMSGIYQGVKAFDKNYACLKAEEFFNLLLKSSLDSTGKWDGSVSGLEGGAGELDCAIAGCTEIPILLDWLQGSSQVSLIQSFLTEVTIINPVISALQMAEIGYA